MSSEIQSILDQYQPDAPLDKARTPPAAWYTRDDILKLERKQVFGRTWQVVAPVEKLRKPGDYVTANVAGEPIVVVRGEDGDLRAFFNVCRHHAAEVMTQPCGNATSLRCPYHAWTYGLDGSLKTTPEFKGVDGFDKAEHGLLPMRVATWESFVFVCQDESAPPIETYLGDLVRRVKKLGMSSLHWVDRQSYEIRCNWKVFVDNYLDGGYHVPYIHKDLGSVLSLRDYSIENGERFCEQASPISSEGGQPETAAVRTGKKAYYYWLYPNFMFNLYEGYMDTHIVCPTAVDRCTVIFDFFFADTGDAEADMRRRSIAIANHVQGEDIGICESVQRGIASRAYDTGRLSVRREAGEHLFHRLLHADLSAGAC
ncbi:MAG: aromatic ring-hydroxylating dioxygenase subunit alpha [Planctomycetes bacterium]|nr:aromatic ring-hydroxylating dioxygenase subunit alpha [Planctomycetota bacterium]